MKKLLLLLVFSLIAEIPAFSQTSPVNNFCSFTEYLDEGNKDPAVRSRRKKIEADIVKYKSTPNRRRADVITIPVVFHVLYTNSSNNPTDEQLQSQIDILNEGFRLTNSNVGNIVNQFKSIASDTKIEFCLAKVDPNGNETTGIERKQSTKVSWESEGANADECKRSAQGGLDGWDQDLYFNIWSVPQMAVAQVIGYSSFPGETRWKDGVVMRHEALGDVGTAGSSGFQSVGKVTVHEAGHYLGLYHLWGGSSCGDDEIHDTPTQQSATQGCPLSRSSCGSSLNNVQNYMDYSDPRTCMAMFTQGQAERMQDVLATARPMLANSGLTRCSFAKFSYDLQLTSIEGIPETLCGNEVTPTVSIMNQGKETITSAVVKVYVGSSLVETKNISLNLTATSTETIQLNTIQFAQVGQNEVKVVVEQPNGQTDDNKDNDEQKVNVNVVIGEEYEFYITTASMNSNLAIEITDNYNTSFNVSLDNTSENGDKTVQKTCLAAGVCYEFNVSDAFKGGANCGDEWSSGGTYVGGDKVVYNGQIYEAKWWTKGDTPGASDPWKLIGECVNSDPTHIYGLRKTSSSPSIFEVTAMDYSSPELSTGPCVITGINDYLNSSEVTIFPNPFKNQLQIAGVQELVQVRIIDLTGRIVIQTQTTGSGIISVEAAPEGIYVIQINGPSTNVISTVLKK